MSRFFKLLYNEEMKIFIRKSTWIMFAIIAILIIGGGLIEKFLGDHQSTLGDDWRQTLEDENAELIKENEKYEKEMENDEEGISVTVPPDMDQVEKNNYYLEHDIKPKGYGAWNFTLDNIGLLSVVSLLTIIIAGGIVAQEFKWGTIKLLLIRPISRAQILLSKYIAVLLFALLASLFLLIASWITGAALFGIEGVFPDILLQNDILDVSKGFEYVSAFKEVSVEYGYKLVNLVIMGTLAFMISTVFKSNAMAIGISIFLLLSSGPIMAYFQKYSWAKYILFANTDLSQYAEGNSPMIEGMTLGFSITVLAVYYIIFLVLSWIVFTKQDVASQ